jgi:hypothetical protein
MPNANIKKALREIVPTGNNRNPATLGFRPWPAERPFSSGCHFGRRVMVATEIVGVLQKEAPKVDVYNHSRRRYTVQTKRCVEVVPTAPIARGGIGSALEHPSATPLSTACRLAFAVLKLEK